MTREEIKESVTMSEVLNQYGIKVRNKMCSCPFHGADRHPSMQIFKDGYKCHTCQRNGDIFRFVMEMDGCDFKTAFIKLGGHYDKHKSETTRTVSKMRFESQKQQRQQDKSHEEKFKKDFSQAISILRSVIRVYEPFSDEWTYAQNKLQYLLYLWEVKYTEQQEIDEFYVYREYRQIRQRFIPTPGTV